MPIHDWSRFDAGLFHSFRLSWVCGVAAFLNRVLPPDHFYALKERTDPRPPHRLAPLPPLAWYAAKADRIVIRRIPTHRPVAVVEILSPGSKANRRTLRAFLAKAAVFRKYRASLLVVDLFPPTPHAPLGIHAALARAFGGRDTVPPAGKPLTVAVYRATPQPRAFVAPVAVGDVLPDVPLFVAGYGGVSVPLEATYRTAFDSVPRRWRDELAAAVTVGSGA